MNARVKTYSIVPAAWVRVDLLQPLFGINPNMASKYRHRDHWTHGVHFKKDPAGRYVYNRERIERWLDS